MTYQDGQRVRFVKAHGSMNPRLKKHVGENATIVSSIISGSRNAEICNVKFDRSDYNYGQWWIRPKYLEPIVGG